MDNQKIINEIRNKIDIVDLISEYIPLSQKGKNYFGVCPFHNDTNPSMSVSREKQIYKCFSCGASGNVFTFVSNYENISFAEALHKLADKVGYKLDGTVHKKQSNINDKYYEIYDLTAKFYQNNINTINGKKAKEYLAKRSIDDEIIKKFDIGYSLDKNNVLIELLQKKGFSYRDLVTLGLVTDNHDIYINRIMFPLYDTNGRIVAFSGRIYDGSKANKYVNTKETPIFKKGQCLYNYHIAKQEVRKKGFVIVMEGFMDVIRASSIGLSNTVALMGTALTNDQILLLKKLSLNIILCFDGDEAGYHATMSVGKQLENVGISPKVIHLNNNDDPDTYILKYGGDNFLALVDNAMNFSDYKISNLKNHVNFNSDMEVSNYVDGVLRETSLIKDDIRREIILKKLANECNLSYNTLEKRLNDYLEKKVVKTDDTILKKQDKKLSKYEKAVFALLYNMLTVPEVIDKCQRENVCFAVSKYRLLANEIYNFYDKYGTVSIADMFTYLKGKPELEELFNQINDKDDYTSSEQAIDDYIKVISDYNRKQEIKRLNDLMKSEPNLLEQLKIAEQIRLIKIGESSHGQ